VLKILVADDHAIVRQGVRQILADSYDTIVYDEASDGQEALDKALLNDYDLVLLDISMPGKSGLEVLRELGSQKPGLPVLILTMHSEQDYAMRVLKLGASGYITKQSAPEELMTAILRVASGGKYVSPSLAEDMVSYLKIGEEEVQSHSVLSEREHQVMCMIAAGKSVKEISEQMALSKRTIRTYRIRILKKMKVSSDAALIRYVVENRLVT
jgi:two-component system invasion response regulator UvrY